MNFRITRYLYTFYCLGDRLSQGLRLRITVTGWLMLGVTFVLAISGVDTSYSLHYKTFSMLVMVLVLAQVSLRFTRRPRLETRRYCPRFATAGTRLRYPIDITNRGKRALRDVQFAECLSDPLPTRQEFVSLKEPREEERNIFDRIFVYYRWMWLVDLRRMAHALDTAKCSIGVGKTERIMVLLEPQRRGRLDLDTLRVFAMDPFGLFRRVRRVKSDHAKILVLPKRYPLPEVTLPGREQREEIGVGSPSQSMGQSDEFAGLRDYRAGDPRRHIHWRSWAKLNRPVVKEFEEESIPRYALVLDTWLENDQDRQVFEETVSVAASFVSTVETRQSLLDLLLVADQAYRLSMGGPGAERASEKMLEILATVQAQPESVVWERLENSVKQRAPYLSAAILVLNRWCEKRQHLVEYLRGLGVQCRLFVIVEDAADCDVAGVHPLPLGEIAKALSGSGEVIDGSDSPAV